MNNVQVEPGIADICFNVEDAKGNHVSRLFASTDLDDWFWRFLERFWRQALPGVRSPFPLKVLRAMLGGLLLALTGCAYPAPPPPSYAYVSPGPRIVSSGGTCLDVQGGVPADGTPIVLFRCHGSPNQSWTFANNQIVGLDGSCLDVQGSAPVNGAPLLLVHCDGSPSQRWIFSGSRIVGIGGKCMDTANGDTFDRTPVLLAPCGDAPSQSWSIE